MCVACNGTGYIQSGDPKLSGKPCVRCDARKPPSRDAERLIKINETIQRAGIDPFDRGDADAVAFCGLCWMRDNGYTLGDMRLLVDCVWKAKHPEG